MTLLIVSFTFLILTTPAYIFIFYANFYSGSTSYYYAGFRLFNHVSLKLDYTNHGINFFLYVLSGKIFSSDLLKLFNCNREKPIESPAVLSNTVVTSVS